MDAKQRHELCVGMLAQTLELAAQLAPPHRTWLVSSDSEAKNIAATLDIACIDDRWHDLNAALEDGRAAVHRAQDHADLLILPTDLTFATAEAIRRAVIYQADVIIVGDSTQLGTNLLYIRGRAARDFKFVFGPDSFRRHCDYALNNGLSLAIVDDPLLAFDLDAPSDYWRWRGTIGERAVGRA
jgi:2-phospho-L-lactate guanylyltransferase